MQSMSVSDSTFPIQFTVSESVRKCQSVTFVCQWKLAHDKLDSSESTGLESYEAKLQLASHMTGATCSQVALEDSDMFESHERCFLYPEYSLNCWTNITRLAMAQQRDRGRVNCRQCQSVTLRRSFSH